MKIWYYITCIIGISSLASCFSIKPVYTENWEGNYRLIEYNCCGDTATTVKLNMVKDSDQYKWQLTGLGVDTIVGIAKYNGKSMSFYVNNTTVARNYFVKEVRKGESVFKIVYSGDYYTKWQNELRNHRQSNMLFTGVDFHFRKK